MYMFCIKVLEKNESANGNDLLFLPISNGNLGQSKTLNFVPTQILPLKQICVGFYYNIIFRKLKSALLLRYSSSGVAYNTPNKQNIACWGQQLCSNLDYNINKSHNLRIDKRLRFDIGKLRLEGLPSKDSYWVKHNSFMHFCQTNKK